MPKKTVNITGAIYLIKYAISIPGPLPAPVAAHPHPSPGLLSALCASSWRPCAGRDHPEEGREGGAAWDDDVDWNEGVNVPGQKLDGRGN